MNPSNSILRYKAFNKKFETTFLKNISKAKHQQYKIVEKTDNSAFYCSQSGNIIQLKTSIFSRKVLAGCVCSDDVSQAINDENGYCKLQVKLDKDTNKLEITL
jgi:hypothetical protein